MASSDISSAIRFARTTIIVMVLAAIFLATGADGQVQNSPATSPTEKDERIRRMEEMDRRIRQIEVLRDGGEVKIVDKPLLRFDDPARGFHDGTIWAFGTSGRPVALGSLEKYESFWSYYLVALSESTFTARAQGGVR